MYWMQGPEGRELVVQSGVGLLLYFCWRLSPLRFVASGVVAGKIVPKFFLSKFFFCRKFSFLNTEFGNHIFLFWADLMAKLKF